MYIVGAQLSLCTDVDQSLYTSTNPHLYCLVVTAPLSQDKKESSSWSSHVADLVDLHTYVKRKHTFYCGNLNVFFFAKVSSFLTIFILLD